MADHSETIFRGDFSQLKDRVDLGKRVTAEFFELEREKIFRRCWLAIASVCELPEKGSFLTRDIPPLKINLLITRRDDDSIQAFHNVCRHRGQKLVHEAEGRRGGFACPFHGWVFSNKGSLTHVTDAGQFCNLNQDEYGLATIHTEVWEGIVFVCLAPTPAQTLKEWLGPMYDQYKGFNTGRVKICDHRISLRTNWNIATNAFQEGYHTPYIHRLSVPDYQGGKTNPDRHRPYLEVGEHFGRYSAHGNPDHAATPAEEIIFSKVPRPFFPAFPQIDMNTLPPGINPSRFKQWAFDIIHIFPNLVISPNANVHGMMWFWPTSPTQTEIWNMRFSYATKRPSDRIAQGYSITRAREVVREDLAPMETNLVAIESGALSHVVLSMQERLIQNHYRVADDLLAVAD